MLNKKKLLIIAGLLLIVIAAILTIVFIKNRSAIIDDDAQRVVDTSSLYMPEFMGTEAKTKLGLPTDSKIQILTKNESGEATVYRVIKRDADIVLDPSRVGDSSMIQPIKPVKN